MPTNATTKISAARIAKKALVETERGMPTLRSLEPLVRERQRRRAVYEPARNPHDQPRQPLVVDGIEPDARHPHRRIVGVPWAGGKAHQGTKRSTDQR